METSLRRSLVHRRLRRARAVAVLALGPALALGPTLLSSSILATPSANAASADSWPLIVSELAPDNASYDNYEFIEVTNPTTMPKTIGDGGYSLAYMFADNADTSKDIALTPEAAVTLQGGETVVLWLSYKSSTVDSNAHSVDEFRTHWKIGAEVKVVRVTGQNGMANGGNRGVRILDAAGNEVSRSFYPAGSASPDLTVQFQTPRDSADLSMDVLATKAQGTPGTVDPAQLENRAVDTTPTETPNPTEPTKPIPGPAGDSLVGTLQVTELVPDTSNMNGADAYEYIEVTNVTNTSIDLSHYELNYLYTADGKQITNAVVWPMEPANTVLQPGKSLVVWVRNGKNDALTKADFATHYGVDETTLTLAETHIGGMANSGGRGMEIRTKTGDTVQRVFYNISGNDDTLPDQGIQYVVNPDDFSLGILKGLAPASPGTVTPDQIPSKPVEIPADTQAPTITDNTADELSPDADATITHTITDNVQVRDVTLYVRSNADTDFTPHTVLRTEGDTFTYTIAAADLTGKRWFEYYVEASDGVQSQRSEVRRVPLAGVDQAPLRLNVSDGQYVSGITTVSAAGDAYPATARLQLDGTPATSVAALESAPTFAFEASNTDAFFRNGVLVGDDVLHIFDEGFYANWVTVSTPVPLKYVQAGEPLVVDIAAGTKAKPGPDLNENNDDFTVRNVRLILPDGRTLTAAGYDDPSQALSMGDSTGKIEVLHASFTIPDDAYTAQAIHWDTTKVVDGTHTVTATDASGNTVTRTVNVDNTAPQITSPLRDGALMHGAFKLDAQATDSGSGVDTVTAMFDGEDAQLGQTVSSLALSPGEHTLTVVATDKVGNRAERTVTFTTPEENPTVQPVGSDGVASSICADPAVSVQVGDSTNDSLTASFRAGSTASLADGTVTGTAGTVEDANALDRADGVALKVGEATLGAGNTGASGLPYHAFTTEVPEDAGADAQVRIAWSGKADAGARVRLLAQNATTNVLDEVAVGFAAQDGAVALEGLVPAADYNIDGKIHAIVQHSIGWAGSDRSARDSGAPLANPNDTPRADYDFTLAWESDTQYYNADPKNYKHQQTIHQYVLDQRDNKNIQYLFHTGDIVDNSKIPEQWTRATAAYKMLDDAHMPYGVLAGNHDVAHAAEDYTEYGQNFGADRFEGNPWYGGSYEDNRGHYDLFTAGGIDFIVVSLGWGPNDDSIKWMNQVLAQYPERTAILSFHEFILTTGGLGPIPQQIMDEVVAKNPNVKMVLSGHYHDSFMRTDKFDDNGDGTAERTVTSMLFDYQALPEGGEGYLRLMHFDNASRQMIARTYSPSLDDYDADDDALQLADQEFTLSYDQLGITPKQKQLTTNTFRVDVLTSHEFEVVKDVRAGQTVTANNASFGPGTHGWYVLVTDPYGGEARSAVQTVTFTAESCATQPGQSDGSDGEQPGEEPGGQQPGTVQPDTTEPGGQPGGTERPGDNKHPGVTQPSGPQPGSVAPEAETDSQLADTGANGLLMASLAAVTLLAAGAVVRVTARRR